MSCPDRDCSWKEIALWLADCHAATASYLGSIKSISKAEKNRHAQICDRAEQMIRFGVFTARPSEKDAVLARLKNAAAECRKKRL